MNSIPNKSGLISYTDICDQIINTEVGKKYAIFFNTKRKKFGQCNVQKSHKSAKDRCCFGRGEREGDEENVWLFLMFIAVIT